MRFSTIVTFGCLMGAMGAFAAEPTAPISGDYEVTVSAGETETWSGDISGTGRIVKNGNGTLELRGNNTFTGGIQINAGYVKISANAAAIGRGPITLTPAAATADNICQLVINKSGTYTNDLTVTANNYVGTDQAETCANLRIVYDVTSFVWNGKITGLGNLSIRPQKHPSVSQGSGPTSATFNGEIHAPGKTVLVASYGGPRFLGKITCANFSHIDAWSGNGRVYLGHANNEIGGLRLRNNIFQPYTSSATDCFGGALLTVQQAWTGTGNFGCLYMGGSTQRLKGINDITPNSVSVTRETTDSLVITSSNLSKLIITGDGTAGHTCRMAVNDRVALEIDAPGYSQTFATRKNTTTEALAIKNGTLKVADTATFANVPAVTVAAGGTLDIQSTIANAFGGVGELTVEGTVTNTGVLAFANDNTLAVTLGSSAKLYLPEGCDLKVKTLKINGITLQGGTYSGPEYGILSGSVSVPMGVRIFDVSAGESLVVDEVLTGETPIRKMGAGSIRFSNLTDYHGSITIDGGDLLVAGENTLGTGDIIITAQTSGDSRLHFVGNATLTNNIVINGDFTDDHPAIFFDEPAANVYTLKGTITCNGNAFFRHNRLSTATVFPAPGSTSCFEGPIHAPGRTVGVRVYGAMHLKGKVTCNQLGGADAHSSGSLLYMYPTENDLVSHQVFGAIATCTARNVLTNRFIFSSKAWTSGGSRMDLHGFDQEVLSLESTLTTRTGGAQNLMMAESTMRVHGIVSEDAENPGPTLTISGEADVNERTTYASVFDGVTVRLDARNNANFRQIFYGRANLTTGALEVVKGTLVLKDKATFANIRRLYVGPNGVLDATELTEVPFPKTLESVELAVGAALKLPSGTTINAQTFVAGEATYTAGTFTPDRIPQLQGGSVIATGTPTAVRWTGAVGDGRFATEGNWSTAPDFVFGSSLATFGDVGGTLAVDVDALFGGIAFDGTAAEGFTLARISPAHALGVSGRITAAAAETAHTHVLDTPMTLTGEVVAHAEPNQAIVFRNALAEDSAVEGRLRIGGAGSVVFEGTNTVAGAMYSTSSLWRVTGLLATPNHIDQGEPEQNGANSVTVVVPGDGVTKNGQEYGLCLSNAVVEKPVFLNNTIGRRTIWSMPGTTNEIKGKVRFANLADKTFGSWQPIRVDAKSELVFSGGAFFSHSFRPCGSGTVRFVGKPISALQSAGLNPCQSRVVLETTGNTFANICLGYGTFAGKPTLEFAVSGAMTNGNLSVGVNGGDFDNPTSEGLGKGPYTANLLCTTQRCEKLAVTSVGVLTGTYPAMLEVSKGAKEGDPAGFAVAGPVMGGVGFHMCGEADGVLRFSNRAFETTGDLEVSSGTMAFAAGATWNGERLTVRGSGTFKVGGSGVFGRAPTEILVSDNWKLDIPAGATLVARKLIDAATGRPYAAGTYGTVASGASNTSLASHFVGDGKLCVRNLGVRFILQ